MRLDAAAVRALNLFPNPNEGEAIINLYLLITGQWFQPFPSINQKGYQ